MSSFDDNIFNNEAEKQPTGEFAAGEYHYSRPEQSRSAYSDASYISSDHATAVPPRYNCGEDKPEKPRREKRGMGAGAIVALCLVCALLGGAGGGLIAGYFAGANAEPDAVPALSEPQSGIFNVAEPAATATPQAVPTVSGDTLAAGDIYSIATEQAVAITTEVTYASFFGYSTAPVSGSGFIVSTDGYILTNYHVIEDAAQGGFEISVLTYDGTEYIASIVGYEEDNDVAVLKIEAEGLSAVTVGDSDLINVGDSVYAVGNPLGELQYTMTSGMVSAMDRDITTYESSSGTYNTINMFQIDAAVNSGNSGGPLYNDKGQVIGIVTAKYSDTGVEGLGFAIPVNDAVKIAEDLITKGYVSGKAYMGVNAGTLPASVSQYYGLPAGAYIESVEPGSSAEKAGISAGDIIVAIDDVTIRSGEELISAKKAYRAGDSAVITVARSGQQLELTIVFDEEVPEETQGTVGRSPFSDRGGTANG